MTSVNDLHPDQLRSLLHFYADAGVEWLMEETSVDRIAEMQALKAAQGERRAVEQAPAAPERENRPAPSRPESRPAERRPAREAVPAVPAVAIPDSQAVAEAAFAASSARSLGELRTAMEGFTGCNLRHSARGLVFADGNERPAIMVIGPMPNADDDREGLPFAGRQGAMLDRMLAGIGIARPDVLLTNIIPWRPPGNRVPSARETDICRPFIERQIALAEPNHLLLLGNFAARFFLGGTETIHQMRGVWREIHIAGRTVPALATLHPQDLVAAPISKRLAWQDLLAFRAGLKR